MIFSCQLQIMFIWRYVIASLFSGAFVSAKQTGHISSQHLFQRRLSLNFRSQTLHKIHKWRMDTKKRQVCRSSCNSSHIFIVIATIFWKQISKKAWKKLINLSENASCCMVFTSVNWVFHLKLNLKFIGFDKSSTKQKRLIIFRVYKVLKRSV